MGLRRNRNTPYAPQRQGAVIDYAAQQRGAAAMRAQVAAVEEQALRNLTAFREESNPLAQLVKRCQGIEGQVTELTRIVGRLAAHVETITTMEANRHD